MKLLKAVAKNDCVFIEKIKLLCYTDFMNITFIKLECFHEKFRIL